MRARLFMTILLIAAGCERKPPAPPVRITEEERIDALVRPHFENLTIWPSDIRFRNLRELGDGRICGEVDLKNDRGDWTGFGVLLDSMTKGERPIIVHANQPLPAGYRDVARTCMDKDQRERLERQVERQQRTERWQTERAYEEARRAMQREQMSNWPAYYNTPPRRR